MQILGVRVDNLSKEEILAKIESFFVEERFHQIATVNPEFILEAQKNSKFKHILNGCNFCVADGFGIRLAFFRFGKILKCRFAGADLMHEILKMAEKKKVAIFLAINKSGLSGFAEIRDFLLKLYPELEIYGQEIDPQITSHQLPFTSRGVLLCNFGAPSQEIFLNSAKNGKIRIAMGVGGTFDFVTGKIKRAPVFIRKIGLEWLWRFFQQPKRIGRIINAVIIFPIKIIFTNNAGK